MSDPIESKTAADTLRSAPENAAITLPSGPPSEPQQFRIDAGWIITMDSQMQVLDNHSLLVDEGRIVACLPWQQAQQRYPDFSVEDRRTAILMPGLINAHTHLAMNLLRGFADDKPLHDWLNNYIWPAEAKHVGPQFVRDGTQLAVAESLLAGVTTVNDMYYFPDATAEVCRDAGMRACVGLLVLDFPTAWANSVDEYFDRGLAVHDAWRHEALIHTAFALHAPYTVSRESLERVVTLSAELDVPVHMHVHETASEVQQFEQQHGVRPIQRLDEIGLLNPGLIAVHLTQLTDAEIQQLAQTGVNAIHCPESNLKLASGFCPVADLLEAGVNVAVGTDGAASNNDLDLLGELRSAAFLAKAISDDASILPALQALRMVTIDAARALGMEQSVGSLEPGKAADCIVIEPDLGMIPVYDPASQVLFTNSSHCVSDVWVDGKPVVKGRQLLTLDDQRLRHIAEHWKQRILAT